MNNLALSRIVYYKNGIVIVKLTDGTYMGGYGCKQWYKIKGLETDLTEEEISKGHNWSVNFKPNAGIYSNAEWVRDPSEDIDGTSYLVITDDDGNKIHCTYDEDNEVYLAQDGHIYYEAHIIGNAVGTHYYVDYCVGYMLEKDFLDCDSDEYSPETLDELIEDLTATFIGLSINSETVGWIAKSVRDWLKYVPFNKWGDDE